MLLQRALSPCVKLLCERLVEPTDRTRAGSNPHEGLGHFSHLMGTCPGYEHLRQPFCDVRFIAAVPLKSLSVKLTFPIPRHVDVLEPPCGGHQIASIGAIAIAFALGA